MNNPRTLAGSFSAVSTPIFATKCSFCTIFRDLQDLVTDLHNFGRSEITGKRLFADLTTRKQVLESWSNLSLDPNSTNYVSKIMGDQVAVYQSNDGVPYVEYSGSFPNKSKYILIYNK